MAKQIEIEQQRKIHESDYIRCTYEDESELYGVVLWVSPNQQIITVNSSDVLTLVNITASSLEIIEVMKEGE